MESVVKLKFHTILLYFLYVFLLESSPRPTDSKIRCKNNFSNARYHKRDTERIRSMIIIIVHVVQFLLFHYLFDHLFFFFAKNPAKNIDEWSIHDNLCEKQSLEFCVFFCLRFETKMIII